MRAKLILPLVLFTLAETGRAESHCPPCPNGTTRVIAHIRSEGLTSTFARSMVRMGENQVDELMRHRMGPLNGGIGRLNTEHFTAGGSRDIRKALLAMAARCERVAGLHFTGHGESGLLDLGDGELTPVQALDELEGLDCVMAPDANVYFTSCHLGASCRGQDLMRAVALRLLPKGGTIRAATAIDVSHWVGPFSLNFSPQILTVEEGWKNVSWRRHDQCPGKSIDRKFAAEFVEKARACRNPDVLGNFRSLFVMLEKRMELDESRGLDPSMAVTIHWGSFDRLYSQLVDRIGMAGVLKLLDDCSAAPPPEAGPANENGASDAK